MTVYGGKDEALIAKLKAQQIRLIICRHPQSVNNGQNIISSSISPGYSLTSRGFQQLAGLVQILLTQGIEVIYTSPLYRTLQTTQYFGELLSLKPEQLIVDERLKCQNFGIYEKMNFNDYRRLYPSRKAMIEAHPPEGEAGLDVLARTSDFLWSIANGNEKTVLIVTHAFNFCHIRMCLKGEYKPLPLSGTYNIYDFSKS